MGKARRLLCGALALLLALTLCACRTVRLENGETFVITRQAHGAGGGGEAEPEGKGWLVWAVLSAVCASLTSILGKVGMTGVDSYVGTAIRNMVVLAMAWALVLGLGLQREIPTLSRKNWGFLAVSGVSTGLSWMFYYRALQEGPASVVAPIDKLSILVTVGFSCLVLRERLSRRAAAGLLVLTCGTLLLLL